MSDTLLENLYIRTCESRGEPSWLLERRQAAWRDAQELKLPRLERTRIEPMKFEAAIPGPQPEGVVPDAQGSSGASGTLVTANGRTVSQKLDPELQKKGVLFMAMEEAVKTMGEKLKAHLFTRDEPDKNLLTALHRTYMNGGFVLYVPKGVEIEVPFEAISYFGTSDAYPHTLVILEPMARVTLVETYTSSDESPITINAALEAHVGQGAFLRYASVQKLSDQAKLYRPRVAYLDRDSRIEWVVVEAGSGKIVTNNETILEGEGSSAQSYAVFLGAGDQVMDFQTRMNHFASHTNSDMDSKGILKDRSKAVYTGFTNIRKFSKGCESWQTEKTLMLSPESRVDLIPALWIDDDDVARAGHSATAGQVNREQLYYLMSRGVSEPEALLLLVSGFLSSIINRIPIEEVRDEIQLLAEKKVKG